MILGIKNNNERAFSPVEYSLCKIFDDYKIDYELDMDWPLKIIVNSKEDFNKIKTLCKTGKLSSNFDKDINFSIEWENPIIISIWYEKMYIELKRDIISSIKRVLLSIIWK